jgi:hypothetical protein
MDETLRNRIERVLAAYGADPARWPAEDREVLAPRLGEIGPAAAEARAIDAMLQAATVPELPAGAERRLLTRLDRRAGVAGSPWRKTAPGSALRWISALPLAASLALGMYLGAVGTLDRFLPETVTGELATSNDDNADLSGVSEAEAYAEEDLS